MKAKYKEYWNGRIRVYANNRITLYLENRVIELNIQDHADVFEYIQESKLSNKDMDLMIYLIQQYYDKL